jgi:hypothetical protein
MCSQSWRGLSRDVLARLSADPDPRIASLAALAAWRKALQESAADAFAAAELPKWRTH